MRLDSRFRGNERKLDRHDRNTLKLAVTRTGAAKRAAPAAGGGEPAPAHVSFLDVGAFEGLTEPTMRGTRRLAGIDLNKARNRHVVDAVNVVVRSSIRGLIISVEAG